MDDRNSAEGNTAWDCGQGSFLLNIFSCQYLLSSCKAQKIYQIRGRYSRRHVEEAAAYFEFHSTGVL